MYHLARSLWGSTEVTDVVSQEESTTLESLWSGVKNFFTQDEIEVEMQSLRPGALEAPPPPQLPTDLEYPNVDPPRLLSAGIRDDLDEPAIDTLVEDWDELPAVEEAPEFMSREYVENLEMRELEINQEFAETLTNEQLALFDQELPDLVMTAWEVTGPV